MINRLLLLGLLAGCAPPPPLTFGLHRHDEGPILAFVGEGVALQVFVTTPGGNARQLALPSKPHCAVTAPSGASVDCRFSDWARPTIDEDNGVAVLVFTPTGAGWFEAKATLDEGDEVTWRVFALERHGEVVARFERQCAWVDRLRGGGWLCDDLFLRDGEPPQPLSALTSVAGDFVWAFNTGEVRRFHDSGAGPLTPEPRLDTGIFVGSQLLATENDAVLHHPGGFTLLEVGPSGALEKTASFERTFVTGAVVRRLGAVLLVGEPAGEETDACTFSISPASLTPVACRRYPGKLIGGGDGAGLMLVSGAALRVVNATLDDGATTELPDLLATGGAMVSRRGLVVFRGQVVPRVSAATLQLESYAGALVASEQFTWAPGPVTTVLSR